MRAYFAAINHHKWQIAWRLSGETGTFAQFRAGFRGTMHDTVRIQSVDGNVVTASLTAAQTDNTVKYYTGTYTVTNGVITAKQVTQTG